MGVLVGRRVGSGLAAWDPVILMVVRSGVGSVHRDMRRGCCGAMVRRADLYWDDVEWAGLEVVC
jgi:hypothetical protein